MVAGTANSSLDQPNNNSVSGWSPPLKTILTPTPVEMGRYVAEQAAADLREAIDQRGNAQLIVATGASQFEVLSQLVDQPDVDWSKVDGFHLDEYVGLDDQHPASFCGYLRERFVSHIPIRSFHYMQGDQDPTATIAEASKRLSEVTIDVALVGIGENGHLAFNDPPADFETLEPYLLVELDRPCREQQVGEGWFASLDEVPTHAISMSVNQIMKARTIYCSVPDRRKAMAVRDSLLGDVSPNVPASILQRHPSATLIIDREAASQLKIESIESLERFA